MIQKPQISPTSAAKKRFVQFFNPFTEPEKPSNLEAHADSCTKT